MAALWSSPAFIDLCCREPYSLQPSSLGTSNSDVTGYPWSLTLTVRLCNRLLLSSNQLLPAKLRSSFQKLVDSLAASVARDTGSWSRLFALFRAHYSQVNNLLASLVCETVGRIRSIQSGTICLIPAGLAISTEQPPIFYVLLVSQYEDRPQFFELALVNATGYGTEFHPFRVDEQDSPGTIERDLLFVLRDVHRERLLHSSFWVALYRLLVRPAPTNVHTLYTILLPHANSKPLLSNWNVTDQKLSKCAGQSPPKSRCGAWFTAPGLRTVGSTWPGTLAIIHYILRFDVNAHSLEIHDTLLLFWWATCLSCEDDLATFHKEPLQPFQIILLQFACRRFATHVSRNANLQADNLDCLSSVSTENCLTMTHLTSFRKLLDNLDSLLTKHHASDNTSGRESAKPAFLEGSNNSTTFELPAARIIFPMFGKFRPDVRPDFDQLAGAEADPPLILPIDLAGAVREVKNIEDVCTVLRDCLSAVTILSNQHSLMSNTYTLRFHLIKHVILECIPLPLPIHSSQRQRYCFWANQQMRRELQTEILRVLHLITRHFVTACYSMHNTRDVDAQRVIAMAAICTIADIVLRHPTKDGPSPVGRHYSGDVNGPVRPFVFDITFFGDQSEFFLLTDPVLCTARTQVLDYLMDLRDSVADDHIIFSFEKGMELSLGDLALTDQLCLQYGFKNQAEALPYHFTGEPPELLEFLPEMAYLRDIVFYFKSLMVPEAAAIPPLRNWNVSDAVLRWTYNPNKKLSAVRGFRMALEGVAYGKNDYFEKRGGNERVLSKFLGWIGMAPRRVPPSAADPSNLALENERVETEDDVLHLQKLPNFGIKLSAQDCEVLLQYLTAPYIRIPLILQFFSDETRIDCLVCSEVQGVLLAALFEPAMWQKDSIKISPDEIPPKSRAALSTPLGLLFNELSFASDLLIQSIEEMLDIAIDKDTGHPDGHSANLLLFVVRLAAMLDRYIMFLIKHERNWNTREEPVYSYCGSQSLARGLKLRQSIVLEKLLSVHACIRQRLMVDVLPLLEDWMTKAVRNSQLVTACKISAHVALIFADHEPIEYTVGTVSHFVAALFFVFTHHRFTTENPHKVRGTDNDETTKLPSNSRQEVLGVSEMEIFMFLQRNRAPLLQWLREHSAEANDVMEYTIEFVSFASDKAARRQNESKMNLKSSPRHSVPLPMRNWTELTTYNGFGRFVTDSEAKQADSIFNEVSFICANGMHFIAYNYFPLMTSDTSLSLQALKNLTEAKAARSGFTATKESVLARSLINLIGFKTTSLSGNVSEVTAKSPSCFELWLRIVTKQTADTEINFQTAEFSLRRNPMELLEDWVNDYPDFVHLFGTVSPLSTFQCAVVSATSQRYWCRLIGRRHDLQQWERRPNYRISPEFSRPYNLASLRSEEAWVAPILDSWLPKHLPGAQLFICDASVFSILLESSVASSPSSPSMRYPVESYRNSRACEQVPYVRLQTLWPPLRVDSSTTPSSAQSNIGLKEVVVTMYPTTIEIFDIVEEGRQWYTRFCYSSNIHISFAAVPSALKPQFENITTTSQNEGTKSQLSQCLRTVTLASPGIPARSSALAAASLVITRHLSEKVGPQKFVPSRHLHGLIPACLLIPYEFWQNLDDKGTIYAYSRKRNAGTSSQNVLVISILPAGPSVKAAHGGRTGDGFGLIRRFQVTERSDVSKKPRSSEEDTSRLNNEETSCQSEFEEISQQQVFERDISAAEVHTLIDMKYAPPHTNAAKLREMLMRIEDQAHILAWTKQAVSDKQTLSDFLKKDSTTLVSVDLLEFPRLGISFKATPKTSEDNQQIQISKFHCDQHAGLYLSTKTFAAESLTSKVIQGIPNSVLLENDDGDLFLLTDAIAKPLLVQSVSSNDKTPEAYEMTIEKVAQAYAQSQICPTIVLDRNDETWRSNLGDSKHYLYKIHSSRSYLFAPTPASALYLLLLRFLDQQFEEVCKIAESAHFFDSKSGSEESQIWRILNSLDSTTDPHPDAHAARIKLWLAASGEMLFSARKRSTGIVDQVKRLADQAKKAAGKFNRLKGKISEATTLDDRLTQSPQGKIHQIFLIISPDQCLETCSWDVHLDVVQYRKKISFISGGCRLTAEEELEALRCFPSLVQSTPSLHNRQTILQALIERKRTVDSKSLVCVSGLHLPSVPHVDDFDGIVDKSGVIEAGAMDVIANLVGSINVFKRPEEPILGSDAIAFYFKAMERSLKLSSDFHFLYELLTESCPVAVMPNESSYMWGVLLSRYLGAWDFQTKGHLMSILKILIANPQVAATLPHLKDDRKHKLPLGLMLRSHESFQKFLRDVLIFLREKHDRAELVWPEKLNPSPEIQRIAGSTFYLKALDEITNRIAVGHRSSETSCSRREISEVDASQYTYLLGTTVNSENSDQKKYIGVSDVNKSAISSFATQPLSQHLKLSAVIEYVSPEDTRRLAIERGAMTTLMPTVSENLPFSLRDHAAATSPLGKCTLKRLQDEMKAYSIKANNERIPQLSFLKDLDLPDILASNEKLQTAADLVRQLRNLLVSSYMKDGRFVDFGIRLVVKMANFPPDAEMTPTYETEKFLRQWGFIFGKIAHLEPTVTFDALVSLLLSSKAEQELKRMTPFISTATCVDVLSLTAAILFVVNRRAQLCQALHEVTSLLNALVAALNASESDNNSSTPQLSAVKIRLLSCALTNTLHASRHYVSIELMRDDRVKAVFDPRFLAFEFAYNLLLRKSQIDLIRKFVAQVAQQGSLCHQAIMGAGKTTVVAPLLALLLADGNDLVVQVVPHTLLEFTRTVMQERFSAVIKKGVLTFSFSRYQSITPQLFSALVQAKEKKAIVLATPTSVKSVFLKVIQLFHILNTSANEMSTVESVARSGQRQFRKLKVAMGRLLRIPVADTGDIETHKLSGKLNDEEFRCVRRELDLALRTLNLFKSSVLLLDEVDLILHPLKSELHWPIGERLSIDFTQRVTHTSQKTHEDDVDIETGLRWKIPWHIIDAVFYAQQKQTTKKISVPFGNSREAWIILEEFRKEVQCGLAERSLQRTPHLVVLDENYYHTRLKIHLARWTHFGLRAHRFQGISQEKAIQYISLPLHVSTDNLLMSELFAAVEQLQDVHVKMLNYSRQWLNSYLPHVIQKVNRVGYGIMKPNEVVQQLAANPSMPHSRLLLAIPFIGKDSPSTTSEFAHPDIVIGLTILAYRYNGLRATDFSNVMTDQLRRLADGFGPVRDRHAALEFIHWIETAGARVRGTKRRHGSSLDASRGNYIMNFGTENDIFLESKSLIEAIGNESLQLKKSEAKFADREQPPDAGTHGGKESSFEADEIAFQKIWPLELISTGNSEQLDLLYRLLWKEPLVIKSYLFNVIFPLTMQHASYQLSASGQELGGSMMFPTRLGFSGTPSVLLPLELGAAAFEPETDGKFIHYLTSPDIATVSILPDYWDVSSMLSLVASRLDINAFIDSGALVTGKSNFEVARLLLEEGLDHIEGVVFLDEEDRQMVLVRDEWRVMKIAQCGLSLEKRFTFYDQVHTTGQDIKQAATAKALITIGKDMTFRDFAQGSWRMRGIGVGQQLELLVPPEVADLVEKNARQSRTLGISQRLFNRTQTLVAAVADMKQSLAEICAWLVVRGIQSESMQLRLLCQHNLFNIWRKNAFSQLCNIHSEIGSTPLEGKLLSCLQLFRDQLDFFIPSTSPNAETLQKKLSSLALTNMVFTESDIERQNVAQILQILEEHDNAAAKEADAQAQQTEAVEAEVTQEQEEEQEEEEEEEQEQEQEQEHEKEQEQETESAAMQKYSRSGENPITWKLKTLASRVESHPSFYSMSKFGVLKRLTEKPRSLAFPPYLQVSRNHFDMSWSHTTFRRLKNVLVVMEWIHDTGIVSHRQAGKNAATIISKTRLRAAFDMLTTSTGGKLPIYMLKDLLEILDIGSESTAESNEYLQNLLTSGSFQLQPGEIEVDAADTSRSSQNYKMISPDQQRSSSSRFARASSIDQVRHYQERNLKSRTNGQNDLSDLFNNQQFSESTSKDLSDMDRPQTDSTSALTQVTQSCNPLYSSRPFITYLELAHGLEFLGLLDDSAKQGERQFVLLSLDEAEGVRAAMHAAFLRGEHSIVPGGNVAVALRHVDSKFSTLDVSPYFFSKKEQTTLLHGSSQLTAHACLRFLNSESDFSERQVALLLRALQENECARREEFYTDVRKCRRRAVLTSQSLALRRIFAIPDDVALIKLRAAGVRLRRSLCSRGMSLSDGFHAFDTERRGRLNAAQIYAGLRWLNIPILLETYQLMWKHIGSDSDKFTTEADFVRAFSSRLQQPQEIAPLIDFEESEPRSIRLANISDVLTQEEIRLLLGVAQIGNPLDQLEQIDAKNYEKLKFKVQTHSTFRKVWEGHLQSESAQDVIHKSDAPGEVTSMPMANGKFISIWTADQLESKYRSLTKKNRERVAFSHYICTGNDISKRSSLSPLVLEIEDPKATTITTSPELQQIINVLMPFPLRFKMVWRDGRLAIPSAPYQSLSIWKPIPPAPHIFAAIGFCVTDTNQPPPLNSIRCVPRKWLEPAFKRGNLIWTCPGKKDKPPIMALATGTLLQHLIAYSDASDFLDLRSHSFQLSAEHQDSSQEPKMSYGGKTLQFSNDDLLSGDIILTEQDVKVPSLIPKKLSTSKAWF